MPNILEIIRNAKKGSDTYHLIEKVAEYVHKENPHRSDETNWFDAQNRINRYLLIEKLAERMFEENPTTSYDMCLEKSGEKVNSLRMDEIEAIANNGITPEKIIQCNLKSFANQYYTIRQNEHKGIGDLEEAFEDWKIAIDCAAEKLYKY
ncbi:MAG: hypothetical protein AABX88_01295 [Nanoarchaeota archaeon]